MPVIYLDQLAVLSFALHYLLLLAAKHLLHADTKRRRLLLGALVSTAYTLGVFLPRIGLLYSLPGKLLFSLLPSAVVFGIKNRRRLLRGAAVFCMLTFAFGGGVYALLSLLGGTASVLLTLLAAAAAAYPIIRIAAAAMEKAGEQKNQICPVEVISGEKRVEIACLRDTGNALREPISGQKVIVLERRYIEELIPEAYRLVPFRTVGGTGMIPAFKPQKLLINGQECPELYIGVWEGEFSPDGRYHGLL